MEGTVVFRHIAHIRTDFKEKFGIPRQSGRVGALGRIVFLPEFRNPDALREIEGFSHLWLLFDFSLAHREGFTPTVRPPRLGGNRHVGVFASRSPFRPNPVGLSSVELVAVEQSADGPVLIVSGVDLLDGTPIFDIKPYLPTADAHPEARGGYADEVSSYRLNVTLAEGVHIPAPLADTLLACLADDPRPSYQEDAERVYHMTYAHVEVSFKVEGTTLTVTECRER